MWGLRWDLAFGKDQRSEVWFCQTDPDRQKYWKKKQKTKQPKARFKNPWKQHSDPEDPRATERHSDGVEVSESSSECSLGLSGLVDYGALS